MAEGTKLADAYVQIIPVSEGITERIRQLFGDLPEEGEKTGKETGRSLADNIKRAVAAAGLTTAVGKIIKSSFSEGAALEQSLGGVETLFKKHADTVKKNAQEAYRTAGLSANEYMENVTSFSASLLSSLSGDTKQAAKVADMAMIDMSDNANKFGTDMQSIQNAYQGFAKQNYTMLDNLKLGYGGTKEEMERLLADAEKLSGHKYDISSLSDVYNAIHDIQGELDITGTTAKEASTTFSGSFGSMKAAAKNFLGVMTAGGDAGKAFGALTDTVGTFFGNVKRMFETAGEQADSLYYSFTEKMGMSAQAADALKQVLDTLAVSAAAFVAVSKFAGINKEFMTMNVHAAALAIKEKLVNIELEKQTLLAVKSAAAIGAAYLAGQGLAYLITEVWDPLKVNETAESFEYLSAEVYGIRERADKLCDSIGKLHDEMSGNISDAKKQADSFKTLKDRLFELNSLENKSTAEKAEMQNIVSQLNDDIKGLNLSLDSQTGSLKNNKDIVEKMVDAYAQMDTGAQVQDSLAEATRNAEEAEKAYAEAVKRRNEAKAEGIDINSDEMVALNLSVAELGEASRTAAEDLETVRAAISDAKTAQAEFAEGFGDASQYIANMSDDTLTSIQEVCEKYQTAYEAEHDLVFDQMDLLDEFVGKSDVTKETLIANLDDNINGFTEWENDLGKLKKKVADGIISQDFYNNLEEMGPKGAGYAKAFVDMSDEELHKYSVKSKGIFDEMNDYVDRSMGKMLDDSAQLLDDLIDLPENNGDDMRIAYQMLGDYAAEGYAEGIKNGSSRINDTVRQMIQDAIDTAREAQDSHSPSRIFKTLGGYAGEGYALGITAESAAAAQASADMVRSAISSANSANRGIEVSSVIQRSAVRSSVPDSGGDAVRYAVLSALAEYFSLDSTDRTAKQPVNINLTIGSRVLSKTVIEDINQLTKLNGKSPLI